MKTNVETAAILIGFRFVFPDGTVETVYASDEYAAARIARQQYYGR